MHILIALALAAQTAPAAPAGLPGIWEGQVGNLPVRACFVSREWGSFGAYYYLSQNRLIPLEAEEGDATVYREGAEGSNVATWRIGTVEGDRLRASWSRGRRQLGITLSRVVGGSGEEGPCGSIAFHRPRLSAVRTVSRRATHDGTPYTIIALDHGGRFSASVETFALDGAGEAVRRINAALARPLSGSPPEWFECMRAPLDTGPNEGDLHETYTPAMIARRWLSVNHQYDSSCGGAHPSAGLVYETYDLASGAEVDLHHWFAESAVRRERVEGSEDELKTVLPPLRDAVLAGWRPEGECGDVVREAEYWNIGLRRDGFVFAPSLAHVVQACGEEFAVPFARVRRLLTPEGAANVDALR